VDGNEEKAKDPTVPWGAPFNPENSSSMNLLTMTFPATTHRVLRQCRQAQEMPRPPPERKMIFGNFADTIGFCK